MAVGIDQHYSFPPTTRASPDHRNLLEVRGNCVFLGLVGIAMTIYLISVRGSATSNSENSSESNKETLMAPATDNGIITIPSDHSVGQTVDKVSILQAKGVMLFALVDHSGEAEKVDLRTDSILN